MSKPNIIMILDDDLRTQDAKELAGLDNVMGKHGVTFSRAFSTLSLCGPSRISFLRGQYAHNHGVWGNSPNTPSAPGGFRYCLENGIYDDTVATRLQELGYKTHHMGKFMNGYNLSNHETVPPGWDDWQTVVGTFEDHQISNNGVLEDNPGNSTVSWGDRAERLIGEQSPEEPFMLWIGVDAPHFPPEVEEQYANLFPDRKAPRGENFDEEDVSGKPAHIRALGRLSAANIEKIDQLYRDRLRCAVSIKDLILRIVNALSNSGMLENTYIIHTSDQGYHLGNHRYIQGKLTPYEEDISIPLYIRGPGIPAGVARDRLVANHDIAPTMIEMGGGEYPSWMDGRSLLPLLGTEEPESWRTGIGLESRYIDSPIEAVPETPTNHGIRTENQKLIRYDTGEYEWYTIKFDEQEVNSRSRSENPEFYDKLALQAGEIRRSAGNSAREAEGL